MYTLCSGTYTTTKKPRMPSQVGKDLLKRGVPYRVLKNRKWPKKSVIKMKNKDQKKVKVIGNVWWW